MTGQDLIDWIILKDAQDLRIVVGCGKEVLDCIITRDIEPEICEAVGRGVVDGNVTYSIPQGEEDVVVL